MQISYSVNQQNLAQHIGNKFLDKVGGVLNNADLKTFNELIDMVEYNNRIFLVGVGRSGLVCRFFGMRLIHLGKQAFIVGDTTTPSIREGDLLIAVSGSGNTTYVKLLAEKAQYEGATVVGIETAKKEASPLSQYTNLTLGLDRRIDSLSRMDFVPKSLQNPRQNITPLGTIFEISALIYLESVIGELIQRNQIAEEELAFRHANLE
jgi:6-phospho-3-hexuloisomerase